MKNILISLKLSHSISFSVSINKVKIPRSGFKPYPENSFVYTIAQLEFPQISLEVSLSGIVGGTALVHIQDEDGNLIWKQTARILGNNGFKRSYLIDLERPRIMQPDAPIPEFDIADRTGRRTYIQPGLEHTESKGNSSVFVYYATDRERTEEDNEQFPNYNGQRAELSYGICEVNIPKKRKIGELTRPAWWKFQFKENPDRHFMILGGMELEGDKFFIELGRKLSLSNDQDLFVFVHGYNTNFEEAVLRTGQIAYDLGFSGAPITYSWPSSGKILNYPYDEESIQYTLTHLKDFLIDLKTKIVAKKIHLIAHSMGNRALTNAISKLADEGFFHSFIFNQIILAAPDIDAQLFLKEIAPKMLNCSERTTLYASSSDRALKTSRGLHRSIIRLGESGELITCCEGVDTVDATSTDPSFLGHGYFASTSLLINDIYQLFRFNHNPDDRNLQMVKTSLSRYWQFK